MLAFLKGLSITKYVVAAGALVALVALTVMRLLAAGAAKERTKSLERRIEDAVKVREIKDEVDRLGSDAARDKLRQNWSR